MRKLAIAIFGGLLLLAPVCAAQQIDYNRHLLELQREIPQWRTDVLQVDADHLSISHQSGKLIEQARDVTLQNLETANLLVSRILLRPHLADEISLFGLLGEINSSISALDHDLLSFAGEQNLQAVTVQMFQLKAVTALADSIESRCSSPASATDAR